jgi:hypothetical protein
LHESIITAKKQKNPTERWGSSVTNDQFPLLQKQQLLRRHKIPRLDPIEVDAA